jgi:hypothetical protein
MTIPTNAKFASSAFAEIARETAHFESAETPFLHAWKRGVELAGLRFFGSTPCADIERAQTKWDLCPKMDLIDHALGPMSPAERIFIAALASFYNADDGGPLLRRAGFDGFADLGRLDLKRRAVISGLILNYTGW